MKYVDDTLIILEATIENLWTVKAILRGFKFEFCPWVKFSLVGINVWI